MKLIDNIYKDAYSHEKLKQYQNHLKKTVAYFVDKIEPYYKILDVGDRNPLTDSLEWNFNVKIDNTKGGLDLYFTAPQREYDVIIYSHTIEHQFNPLLTLLSLKRLLKDKGTIYILLPDRGKLLWCKGHYHEIDDYRMHLLIEKADMQIIKKERQKIWRNWYEYVFGFRPILRLFFEFHAIYTIKK